MVPAQEAAAQRLQKQTCAFGSFSAAFGFGGKPQEKRAVVPRTLGFQSFSCVVSFFALVCCFVSVEGHVQFLF